MGEVLVVKRFSVMVSALALASLVAASCGGAPGAKPLKAAQARAEAQEKAADKKNDQGIEAASMDRTKTTDASNAGQGDGTSKPPIDGGDTGKGATAGTALPASATAAVIAKGKGLFTTTCGGCHTLKDAGTSGAVGPNLDDLKASYDRVHSQVENGGGGMPGGLLSGDDLDAVAAYVASATGAATPAKG
jgi:mono/diheme cytochrome c family protein